jgi:hypothetical protein
MTVTIKKSSDKESIHKIWKQLEHKSKFDVSKFCGVLKLNKSPLVIQKEMRGEWE